MKASDEFIALAKKYIAMVEEDDGHTGTKERDAERTETHNELISMAVSESLSPEKRPNRAKIRWLARYLLDPKQSFPLEHSVTYLMFVKDDFMLTPIHLPPFGERDEKVVQGLYTPVKVTIEPIL